MLNQTVIQNSFNKAASSYDTVASIQKICAVHLAQMIKQNLPTHEIKQILDIGTGTGNLVDSTLSIFPNAQYCLNDLSNEMIALVQKKYASYQQFRYQLGDAQNKIAEQYDLMMSNFCFQWFSALPSFLYGCLKRTRYMAFTTLLDGTFRDWQQKLNQARSQVELRTYPNLDIINQLFHQISGNVIFSEQQSFDLHFDSPLAVVRYLSCLGANSAIMQPDSVRVLKNWLRRDKTRCKLNYEVGFWIVSK